MYKSRVFFFVLGVLLAYAAPVLACGGVTATITDNPEAFGVETRSGPGGVTLHADRAGNVYVAAKDIKISSALAEAIAERYLQKKFDRFEHLEFEAFTYDHGDLVYMYHAHVPNLTYGVHVGPVRFMTDHAHVHVSATRGDVYGPGCGLGSGIVDMEYNPGAYPADLKKERLPYFQFNTDFVVREGTPPEIDGRIEESEWQGAARRSIHVGTAKAEVIEYG